MIRIIVEEVDNNLVAAQATECGRVTYKTFDVDLPDVEKWLTEIDERKEYRHRRFVGIEVNNE